jgi:RNA polymerase sigma-70 factor, ECF subfamily
VRISDHPDACCIEKGRKLMNSLEASVQHAPEARNTCIGGRHVTFRLHLHLLRCDDLVRRPAAAAARYNHVRLPMRRDEETDLARRLASGDAVAFDRFVEHFRGKIFHYSWLMCGHREDAEEVAQDTLMKVFESFDQLREPERVRPWVFRIARNACLMKRRRSVFAPAHELSLDELMPTRDGAAEGKLQIADWSSLPDSQALAAEMRAALDRAIAALPEIYRSVILLRDVEELSTTETAQILDINEQTVKMRLHRARLAMRQTLDAYLRSGAHQHAART